MSLEPLRRYEQRIGALPLPGPGVWTVLAVAFLGFGVLMGRLTGPSSAGGARIKLLAQTSPSAQTPTGESSAPPPLPASQGTTQLVHADSGPSHGHAGSASRSSASGGSVVRGSGSHGSGSSGGSTDAGGSEGASGSSPGAHGLPAIRHVFVIVLSDEPYASAFGPASPAHYLTGTLAHRGALLVRYYAVAHEGLADAVALVSGQGPTVETAADCPVFAGLAPASPGADGQTLGKGCVYPSSTATLMSQLAARHLSWRGYVGDNESDAGGHSCVHPALGAADPAAAGSGSAAGASSAVGAAGTGTGAAGPLVRTWRDPFVYFQSVLSSPSCASLDVGLAQLPHDLSDPARTPSFAYIAPDACHDGTPTPCEPGRPAGMAGADAWLRQLVPRIMASEAYRRSGLLVITTDQAPSGGEFADSSACCGQPTFPNLPAPSGTAARLGAAGGGQVGALLLSPFIKKGGALVQDPYNHFSLLATVEQLFGLKRLGFAASPEAKPFSGSIFAAG